MPDRADRHLPVALWCHHSMLVLCQLTSVYPLCLLLQITGNYNGFGGDQRGVPNFYDMFCNGTYGRNKPMIIGEVYDALHERISYCDSAIDWLAVSACITSNRQSLSSCCSDDSKGCGTAWQSTPTPCKRLLHGPPTLQVQGTVCQTEPCN